MKRQKSFKKIAHSPRPWRGSVSTSDRGSRRLIIGLTGGFGAGKSTVAGMFRESGAYVIDADKIAHEVIRPGSGVYRKLVRAFGRSILKSNANIDRRRLGEAAFSSMASVERLNRITHPEIIRRIKEKMTLSTRMIVVIDAPLLIEAGLAGAVNKIVVVKATKPKQIKRLLQRTKLSKENIASRLKSQISLLDKLRLADFVIDNDGSLNNTKKQVEKIFEEVQWKS